MIATPECRAAASETMRREILNQVRDMEAALYSTSASLERIADIAASAPEVVSVGIGDSHLVGILATQLLGPHARELRGIAADQLPSHTVERGALALCHSISGTTSVTVTAARRLRRIGATVTAVTAEARGPLLDASHYGLVLRIPRYEPDAKVPGTLTVSVPLAAVLCVCELAGGARLESLVAALVGEFSDALSTAKDVVHSQSSCLDRVDAAHIVSRPGSAVAAYLQSKLAETIGVTSSVSTLEEWLHVSKHAVTPGVLVVILDTAPNPLLARAVRDETAVRGGRWVAVQDCATEPTSVPGALACRLRAEPKPSRGEVLLQLAFSQWLCLRLLELPGHWAPFQLHRLTRETVRGLSPRTWEFEEPIQQAEA
jgi:fructoselysine-6-P-deglycase FrlB-like protein